MPERARTLTANLTAKRVFTKGRPVAPNHFHAAQDLGTCGCRVQKGISCPRLTKPLQQFLPAVRPKTELITADGHDGREIAPTGKLTANPADSGVFRWTKSAPRWPILNTEWTLADFYEHSFGALENCYRCKPIQGSNPCPSANVPPPMSCLR